MSCSNHKSNTNSKTIFPANIFLLHPAKKSKNEKQKFSRKPKINGTCSFKAPTVDTIHYMSIIIDRSFGKHYLWCINFSLNIWLPLLTTSIFTKTFQFALFLMHIIFNAHCTFWLHRALNRYTQNHTHASTPISKKDFDHKNTFFYTLLDIEQKIFPLETQLEACMVAATYLRQSMTQS